MKKQEFLIPGLALALAAILGGYLVFHAAATREARLVDTLPEETATSTQATLEEPTALTPHRGGYYQYGAVTLGVDQPAGFKNGLSMRVLRVVEDNRCPEDVQCITAGTVSVEVRVRTDVGTPNEKTETHTLPLGEAQTIAGTRITLSEVSPAPKAGVELKASDYRFTFMVSEATTACFVGGCSGQICSDTPNTVSTCEYKESYACYKTARCERQAHGVCGWTQTPELTKCLAQ